MSIVWPWQKMNIKRRLFGLGLGGLLVLLLGHSLAALPHSAEAEPFPVPDILRPNIAFWMRIFTELDTQSGLLVDARNVRIVYQEIRGLPYHSRKRRRAIKRHRRRYRSILLALARNRGRPRNTDEKRVLELFPEDRRSPKVLRRAAKRIRFQLGQRDEFARSLARSGAHMPAIEQTFAEAGLPIDLSLLPHIESYFHNKAYSKAKAAGIWQFIPATGRRFLTINEVVDVRLDIRQASVAAAQLLQRYYRALGTWPLAITAYNHGISSMQRAVNAVGTKDFGVIVARYRSSTFGFASRNFYAEFLAVREIVKTPYKYFPNLEFAVPQMFHTLRVGAYMDIVALETYLGLDREEIMRWNPSLRRPVLYGQRRVPKGYLLHVPPGHLSYDDLQNRWAAMPSRLKFAHQIKIAKYRVQPGDTLSDIAKRFETSLKILASFNDIGRPYTIRIGQVLQIPWLSGEPRRYRVKPGDSLSKIAHHFGTTVSALAKINGLRRPYRIRAGQVIRLPFHSQALRVPTDIPRSRHAGHRHVLQAWCA